MSAKSHGPAFPDDLGPIKLDAIDLAEIDRPLRAPMTPEQIQDLKQRLGLNKREVEGRGHTWDVADVVDVVRGFDAYYSAT